MKEKRAHRLHGSLAGRSPLARIFVTTPGVIRENLCNPWTKFLFFLLILIFVAVPVFSQEVSVSGEVIGYGWNGISYGGGAAIGFGEGGTLGLRFLYAIDNEKITFLEFNVFARLYIFGPKEYSGYFVQLNAGPVIFIDTDHDPNRPGHGNISAGVTTGWRFMLGNHFFIEPALRIGYPYLVGGVLAVGFR